MMTLTPTQEKELETLNKLSNELLQDAEMHNDFAFTLILFQGEAPWIKEFADRNNYPGDPLDYFLFIANNVSGVLSPKLLSFLKKLEASGIVEQFILTFTLVNMYCFIDNILEDFECWLPHVIHDIKFPLFANRPPRETEV